MGLIAISFCGRSSGAAFQHEKTPFLIAKGQVWKYAMGNSEPPEDWKSLSLDDAGWKTGRAGFGYGDLDDVTVLEDMRGAYTSVYIRKSFEIERPDQVDTLYLYVNYDDGFIAYLNGKQVALASVKRTPKAVLVEQHEAEGFEEFVIRDARSLLRPGKNVLAIEGHNVALDSSDFSLDPLLAVRRIGVFNTVAEYLADIDELERRLLDQSSYLTRLGFDYEKALKNLRESINSETNLASFVYEVQKIIMQIGDCHASVHSGVNLPESGFLPFRPADTANGVAALNLNLGLLLDAECPYLESIDNIPLEKWLDVAAKYVARGSPQLIRHRSLEWLGHIRLIRQELKVPLDQIVIVGLRSKDGQKRVTKRLRVTNQVYAVGRIPLHQTRVLTGNIGYLLIPTMEERLIEPTVAKIKSFRDTRGLIIDVRDNDGGTYGLLRGIYGFFVPDGASPRVTNIAAYRLSTNFTRDHIEYRPTYRADWDGWNDEERAAIRRAFAAFRPEWVPPAGKFSDWHYMILSRDRSGRGDPSASIPRGGPGKDYFFYDKPVVVLSNAGSFSATDGFLNAFAELPQVTIVGEPSGGGSGATREFQLPKTRVNVALSSMASFRPNGKLFDGNGIEVDIAVKPSIEDFTQRADTVLERAVEVIKKSHK